MVALRRKKGNIFVALICFMFVAVSIFLMMFTQSVFAVDGAVGLGSETPFMNYLFWNPDVMFLTGTFKYNFDFFKDIQSINYPFVIVMAAPIVFSFLSIFFKRFRFINILNFVSIVVCLFVLFFGGLNIYVDTGTSLLGTLNLHVDFRQPLDAFTMPFMIGRFAMIGAAFFSLVNLELCR